MFKYGLQNVRGAEYAEDKEYDAQKLYEIDFVCRHHLKFVED